jgi:hypothetical protein
VNPFHISFYPFLVLCNPSLNFLPVFFIGLSCLFILKSIVYETICQVDKTAKVVYREHFLTTKRGEAELLDEADLLLLKIRSGCPTGDRVHLRLGRSSGWLVCFLPGAFLLLSCSAFQVTAHDDAHGAFMTLPPYTRTREGETRQLGGVVRTPSGQAFKL